MAAKKKMEEMLIIITMSLLFTGVLATNCGMYKPYSSLIVEGTPGVDPSDWPWIVGLFHQGQGTTTFKCGATLVSRHLVVTAAHCVRSTGHTLPGSEILLVMGRLQVENWRQQETVQIRNATNVIVHPSYIRSKRYGADLAVLELDSPIDVTETVTPVCMWDESSDRQLTGSNGTVVGWGRHENNDTVTETPRKKILPIVDKHLCLRRNSNIFVFANNFTFCAENRDGTGPCNGDSGSGMYVLRTRQDGKMSWVLRGIVSRALKLEDESESCDLSNYVSLTDMSKIDLFNTSCRLKYPKTFRSLDMVRIGERYYHLETAYNKTGLFNWNRLLNWRAADRFCRSHGLQLVSIETERENDLIVEYGKREILITAGWGFWLGGRYSKPEGTRKWTSGQPFNYTDWREGQPNNDVGDDDCLVMFVWMDGKHGWYESPCSGERTFLCELEDVCT